MRWPLCLLCLLVLPACGGGLLPTDDDDACEGAGALDIAEASVDLGMYWGGNASPQLWIVSTACRAPYG